jgi:hypothetical protein
MGILIEHAITVAEVARVTELTVDQVEEEARGLAIFIGEDWAGRPAMLELDAHGLVSGSLRRDADQQRAWHDHLERVETWEKDREKVREAAAIEAFRAAYGRGIAQPQAEEVGRGAGRAARDKWEKHNPAPVMPSAQPARSWLQKIGVGR